MNESDMRKSDNSEIVIQFVNTSYLDGVGDIRKMMDM